MNNELMDIIDDAMENRHGPVCLSHYDALCIKAALSQPDGQTPYRTWIGKQVRVMQQNKAGKCGWFESELLAVTDTYLVMSGHMVNHKDVCYVKLAKDS